MNLISAELVELDSKKRGLLEDPIISSDVEWLVSLIEMQIISWLGWNPLKREYTERVLTTSTGAALVSEYPIVELISIKTVNEFGLMPTPIQYAWSGSVRTIATGIPSEYVEVTYIAGLSSLPEIFSALALSLCRMAIERGAMQSGDLNFLNEPPNDIKSLSLPGGLSTTYRDIPSSSSVSPNPTGLRLIDKLLAPLSDYQRRIRV
jgi:hypothetical protein